MCTSTSRLWFSGAIIYCLDYLLEFVNVVFEQFFLLFLENLVCTFVGVTWTLEDFQQRPRASQNHQLIFRNQLRKPFHCHWKERKMGRFQLCILDINLFFQLFFIFSLLSINQFFAFLLQFSNKLTIVFHSASLWIPWTHLSNLSVHLMELQQRR